MSQRLTDTAKRVVCGIAAAFITLFAPTPYVFAEGAAPTTSSAPTSCSPVAPAPAGITKPTGSDAGTYTYNSCTGLWENKYYTWSPATQESTPKYTMVYTCDTTTWTWVTKVWEYDPAAGTFYQSPVVQSTLPAGAAVAEGSLNPCVPAPKPVDPPAQSQQVTTLQTPVAGGSGVNDSATTNATLDNANKATMQNTVGSTATTGDANIQANTHAGDAVTGNAAAMATVVNNVQTTSALNDPSVVKFVATVNGNVQGDLVIDPNMLQPASNGTTLNNTANVTMNNSNNGQITNDINLNAQSGNANASQNTTAGNATSGNATTIANVVNMLNSLVTAGKSFVGVVNINGNMNGNILVPQNLVDSLVASNAPSTTVTLNAAQANSLGISNTNNQAIANNLKSTATTGNAAVTDNTTAGSATTGNANTKVTIFNLTGSQVVGTNCLLVFVNVSGQWVGMIMNAPGATAAALGSGITTSTVNNAVLANSTDNRITNNITANAASGNAIVAENTHAGSARSGNANSAINLMNMSSSDFNLTGWFGILFINVFGNWYGNFGVFSQQPHDHPQSSGPSPSNQPANTPAPSNRRVFRYVEPAVADMTPEQPIPNPLPAVGATLAAQTGVLGAAADAAHKAAAQAARVHDTPRLNAQLIGGVLVLSGVSLLIAERLFNRRKAHDLAEM